ncbi:MAG: hypothetical protein ABIK65_11690 [Candidatus Eisenbacteria bacterium]
MKANDCCSATTILLVVGLTAATAFFAPLLAWDQVYNLGPGVNTPGDERGLQRTYDGSMLLYSSNWAGGDYDVYWATPSAGYEWDLCVSCAIPILDAPGYNDLAPTMTEAYDMVFFGSNRAGGQGGMDIWVTRLGGGGWTEPENLGPPVNSPGDEEMPYISPDGSSLYFGSDRAGSLGSHDVWVSNSSDGGYTWSEPENLGHPVNGAFSERGPSLSPDGSSLFFGSNRPGGEGGVDIWISENLGGSWGEPINAGSPVNTSDDETCPSGDETELYFGSTRPGGYGDKDLYVAVVEATRTEATTWGRIKSSFR